MTVLLRSALREIRGSLGRYLAIMAIVGLGVGFFAGLRMGQPDMIATGADYLQANQFHDVRLLSTLGFTEEDTAYFAAQDSVEAVVGSYFAEFLWSRGDEDVVLVAHALTDGINAPVLKAGRMPENSGECLADELIFTEADLGKTVTVSAGNDEDTLELLVHDSYTIVGIADTPLYLDYDRGTSSIGSGSISGFLLIPAASIGPTMTMPSGMF